MGDRRDKNNILFCLFFGQTLLINLSFLETREGHRVYGGNGSLW